MTPLLWAANIDFGTGMIELLLQSGAKADVRNKEGLTPLELARKWGHVNLIPALTGTKATN
jgi:ankyrin repeat protein